MESKKFFLATIGCKDKIYIGSVNSNDERRLEINCEELKKIKSSNGMLYKIRDLVCQYFKINIHTEHIQYSNDVLEYLEKLSIEMI